MGLSHDLEDARRAKMTRTVDVQEDPGLQADARGRLLHRHSNVIKICAVFVFALGLNVVLMLLIYSGKLTLSAKTLAHRDGSHQQGALWPAGLSMDDLQTSSQN